MKNLPLSAGRKKAKRHHKKNFGKRATAAVIILSGLGEHHKYNNGVCGNLTPIVIKKVAGKGQGRWGVSAGSMSNFFNKHFGGYEGYRAKCDSPEIAALLKRLYDEYMPRGTQSLTEAVDD